MPRFTRKKKRKNRSKQSLLIKGVPGYGEKSPLNGSNLYPSGVIVLYPKGAKKKSGKKQSQNSNNKKASEYYWNNLSSNSSNNSSSSSNEVMGLPGKRKISKRKRKKSKSRNK